MDLSHFWFQVELGVRDLQNFVDVMLDRNQRVSGISILYSG